MSRPRSAFMRRGASSGVFWLLFVDGEFRPPGRGTFPTREKYPKARLGVRRGRALAPCRGARPLYASPLRTPGLRRFFGRLVLVQPWHFGRGGGGSCIVEGILRAYPRL